MVPHRSTTRYWVSLVGCYAIVLSTLFLVQDLTLGFLPIWGSVHAWSVPIRPFLFVASSLWITHRYVRVEPHP